MKRLATAAALSCASALFASSAQAQTTDEKMRILEQEIDQLKAQIGAGRRPATSAEALPAGVPPGGTNVPYSSHIDRSTALPEGATTFVGYGEANYNRFQGGERPTKADLRRFIFGLNHRFNDRLTFHSEVEIEHAVAGKEDEGAVEMEQAWLNYRLSDALNAKGGLFLIPLGILNETHEPATYYGVERNEVETRIIPTTWRELGLGIHGILSGGLNYDAGVTTGFDAGKIDDPSAGIGSGHQEGQLANAHDLSLYGALNYRRAGLLLGGGLFTGNTGQNGQTNPLLKGVAARLTLWDVHAQYRAGRVDLQALYTAGKLGDTDRINAANLASTSPFAAPKALKGAYVQAAYHAYRSGDLDLAPFFRLERLRIEQEEDLANGLVQDPHNNERVKTVGLNFWIDPQVVLKADVQRYATDKTKNRLNLGLGYMF